MPRVVDRLKLKLADKLQLRIPVYEYPAFAVVELDVRNKPFPGTIVCDAVTDITPWGSVRERRPLAEGLYLMVCVTSRPDVIPSSAVITGSTTTTSSDLLSDLAAPPKTENWIFFENCEEKVACRAWESLALKTRV
jgi:hypothetical protein